MRTRLCNQLSFARCDKCRRAEQCRRESRERRATRVADCLLRSTRRCRVYYAIFHSCSSPRAWTTTADARAILYALSLIEQISRRGSRSWAKQSGGIPSQARNVGRAGPSERGGRIVLLSDSLLRNGQLRPASRAASLLRRGARSEQFRSVVRFHARCVRLYVCEIRTPPCRGCSNPTA